MAYSEEIKKKVLEEIKTSRKVEEVANDYNISLATIYRWENSILGVKTIQKEPTRSSSRERKIYSEEEKRQALEKVTKGIAVAQVAAENNIPISTIYRWKKKIAGAKTLENKLKKPNEEERKASIEIKMLIKQGKFEKAKEIAKRFPYDPAIQSQMVTIHMKKGEYEEANKIGEKFLDDSVIQSQILTIYIKRGEYEEAKKIGEKFPNAPEIQSQMIKMHMIKGEYEEARKIGEKFSNNSLIQSQMVTIYMKRGRYKEVKKIAQRFPKAREIQSQMITMHMIKGEYEEARKIGEKFPHDPAIQSQMITIHMIKGEYEEAKKIAEKFSNNSAIQSQMMTIYITKGEYEKAKRIGKKFPNAPEVQTQMVKILDNSNFVEKQEEKVKENDSKSEEANDREKKNALTQYVQGILRKIGNNSNDPAIKEEIEQIEDKWLRTILNSALADKADIKAPAQQFIKQLRKQGYIDEKHKTMIHDLEQKLQQKGKFFDMEFYKKLISRTINQKDNYTRKILQNDDERA